MEWLVSIIFALVVGTFSPVPEWCGTELHFGAEECGACGTEMYVWKTVRDYADEADVPVCAECYGLFATDTAENREAVRNEIRSSYGA